MHSACCMLAGHSIRCDKSKKRHFSLIAATQNGPQPKSFFIFVLSVCGTRTRTRNRVALRVRFCGSPCWQPASSVKKTVSMSRVNRSGRWDEPTGPVNLCGSAGNHGSNRRRLLRFVMPVVATAFCFELGRLTLALGVVHLVFCPSQLPCLFEPMVWPIVI